MAKVLNHVALSSKQVYIISKLCGIAIIRGHLTREPLLEIMVISSFLGLCLLTYASLLGGLPQVSTQETSTTIPNTVKVQQATTNFISDDSAFDKLRVLQLNATTIDWWYFDAVSLPPTNPSS